MAEETFLDPLSAMLMEEEAAKATQHTVKKVAKLSNFLEEQEKDLGVRSSNLTPGKGATLVSSGGTLVSPAPVALPPTEDDGETKQTATATMGTTAVLEDPFEESPTPPDAPSTTLPPVINGKSRQDTSDSVGSTSDLLETLTTATGSGTTASTPTTSTSLTTTQTVSMRVSNLEATTIQEIQTQTHCTITTTAANPNEQTLTIVGTPSAVKAAKQKIRQAAQKIKQADIPLLPGEPCLYIDTKKCAYLGPNGKAKPIVGRLRMTDYRLIFEPEERTPSHVRLMINSGLFEIPLLAMSKFKTSIKNNNTEHFYLHIVCKDVRTFVFKIATDAQTTVRVVCLWCVGVRGGAGHCFVWPLPPLLYEDCVSHGLAFFSTTSY